MKHLTTMAAVAALALGTVACNSGGEGDDTAATTTAAAADGINGDWMIDVSSAEFDGAVDEYVIADGEYRCVSCETPYSVPADGEWHEVDQPGIDEVMVEEVDDRTINIAARYEGEEKFKSTWTVSEDGNTMTYKSTRMGGDENVDMAGSWNRTEAGPEGSHAASGKWTFAKADTVSDAGLKANFNVEGDQFSWSGNGESYTATLGGDPVPLEGDDAGGMIKVERIGENAYRETYMRDGEAKSTTEWTLGEDGKLQGVYRSMTDDEVTKFTANRI